MTKTSILVKPLNASQENSTTLVVNSKNEKRIEKRQAVLFPPKKRLEIV